MGRSKEVDAWFARYENPMKAVVLRVRDVLLGADPRLEECIKWQAPTFTFGGNMASFFPKAKQHASLMFHQGARIPGRHPILEGDGDQARSVKLASVAEANARAHELVAVVHAWIALRGGGEASAPAKKAPAKKAPAKKAPAKKAPAKKAPAKKATAKKATARGGAR